MSALNKDDEFIGFISRTKISTSPEQQVDVYYFKSLQALKSDKILCSKVADSIFGPEKEITLKRTHSGLVASRSAGQICELVMTDPDPHGKIKERHLLVKVLHAKVYAFVFRFSKTPKTAEVEDIYQFTEGLR